MILSIITCTYNSEKYLQECIDSVISQKLNINEYEHIFVDAYSKDNTKSIIGKYKKRFKNVRIISCEPKGVYNAMNEGIKEAKGDYILCLNSDDYLCKDVLSGYIKYIRQNNKYDLFYGNLNVLTHGNVEYGVNKKFFFLKKRLFENFGSNVLIYHPTVIVKTSILFEMGMFNEKKRIASDYGMRLKMLINDKLFCYYPHNITNFRNRENSLSSTNEELSKQEIKYFRSLYLSKSKVIFAELIDDLLDFYVKFKFRII